MGEETESLHTVQRAAKRIELLSVIAAVVAYPAALGFAGLWLIGQHGGLLGFALIWLLGVGVSLRVYAQFLRLWYEVGYPSMKAATVPPTRALTVSSGLAPAIAGPIELMRLRDPQERSPALPSPGPSSATPSGIEVKELHGPSEQSPALTSPRIGAIEDADEWREALRKDWAEAKAKLGVSQTETG